MIVTALRIVLYHLSLGQAHISDQNDLVAFIASSACLHLWGRRFGLGWNAVYHFTDVPSFCSGENIVLFDPHAK